ncbi:MAG TPA: HAMP domain-containing sensor histidine kinase [Leptospiraceae bacterium]|nr:HAMP domain-containing sensor histidine kinase [Leptospiraceae bacterium]HMX35299.1 HAMP domain-containing sensor histidine kinase [Leptospiraceae bacterium]HMY32388.1 HAMP domain-containing sensor histidine kinase [Leptospiraceae bacterium]HMZ65603.1 HAMP domain-containing sensor histidine kinase [Leptospiraceae bacterium]HNA07625.1 HAMP domain-containing sensor histidine kinase [Leptospiraceae bacterium]
MKLTLLLETFTHIVPLPFGIYFSVVSGSGSYLAVEEYKYVATAGIVNAILMVILGTLWRFISLKKIFSQILEIYKSENVPKEKQVSLKLAILRYPFREGKMIVIRWMTGVIGSHLVAILILNDIRPALHLTAPFLFLMVSPISYIAYFFITENELKKVFQLRKIKRIQIQKEHIFQFNSFQRILFTLIAIITMPIIVLGYMLYGSISQLIRLENITLHIITMSVLFPIPVLVTGYVVAKTFRNGISSVNTHLDQLGKGNFSIVSMPTSSDDFGLQAIHLNNIIQKLNSLYKETIELNESLESKVIDRTSELQKALKEMETLAESRKRLSVIGEMASGIVHDIKNPMTTIKAYADLTMSVHIDPSKKSEYLKLILREIDRLSDMTYEILDFSKGNFRLNLYPHSLCEFLRELYDFLIIDFQYAGINLSIECNSYERILFDKERIRRVIINIANNAREAMHDSKKEYFLKIKSENLNTGIHLHLEDNGPGLPNSIEEKIFEVFATEGKAKGNGLGLYMSKKIIEEHNGTISYKTSKNLGTTFTIFLPKRNEDSKI